MFHRVPVLAMLTLAVATRGAIAAPQPSGVAERRMFASGEMALEAVIAVICLLGPILLAILAAAHIMAGRSAGRLPRAVAPIPRWGRRAPRSGEHGPTIRVPRQ